MESKKNINTRISEVRTFIPLQLQYIIGTFFLSLFFMLLYRVAVFFIHCVISFSHINPVLFFKSIAVGTLQDSIVLCWVLAAFSVLMGLGAVFSIKKTWFYRPLHLLLCLILGIVLLLVAAGSAYFTYFNTHINAVAVSWMQSPVDIFKIFLRHPIYLLFCSAFLISIAWFAWLMYCLYNATLFKITSLQGKYVSLSLTIILSVVISGLFASGIFLTVRKDKPLSVSSAYFSGNDFFNQLSVNPIFNLAKSIQEENFSNNPPLIVVDGITAKKTVDDIFFMRNDKNYTYPKLPTASNVVFVLMQDVNLSDVNYSTMPYLSNIASKSLSFTNVYADGENDYNGVFSTLFAYPNVFSSDMMNSTAIPHMTGMASLLTHHRYSNIFYTTYNQRENSTARFLYRNGFDIIMAGANNSIKDLIKKLSNQPYSFFSCVLLSSDNSNHALQKTDNAVKQLLQQAQHHKWFANTLFVIMGANGKEKIPLLMYMPNQLKASKNNTVATQTDIFPTVMTMLDEDYQNEDIFGLCIFSAQREYAISSYKHSVVVRNDKWKYVWRDSGHESLYYKDSDKKGINYVKANFEQAQIMKQYAFSVIQFAQMKMSQKKMNLR